MYLVPRKLKYLGAIPLDLPLSKNTVMKIVLCLALLLCTAPCFPQKEYSILSIPMEYTENANSVVLEESVIVDVTDIEKRKIKKRIVLAVLNKMGDHALSLAEYYDDNSRIKKIDAWIYDAFGKEKHRYKKKHFGDISRTGFNMYSDDRVMFLNYTPTSYPYIAVFESETESGDTAFIPSWKPIGGYTQSVLSSEYRIRFDPANKPRYHKQNLDGYNISISEMPDELIFTASNLKSVKYEEQSPIIQKIIPMVRVALDRFTLKGTRGTASSWAEFGTWMEKSLLDDVQEIPEATVERVRMLVANEPTNEAKARKIYQYVQNKVRYISIQIGIGGWQPMPAREVDQLSYGDCKALTNYTKVLLDAVGVPSYYTILYGDRRRLDLLEDFASIQGDHVILGIPDGDEVTWLECTSQDTPYGFIAGTTDDRQVLAITPEGGKIMHTKKYRAAESLQHNEITILLDVEGNASAEFEGVSFGVQYGHKFMLPKKKKEDLENFYKNRWSNINGFEIESIDHINDREKIAFTENLKLKIPRAANAVGEDFLFTPNLFNQNTYIPPRIIDRKQDLAIERGYVDIDTVIVKIPAEFSISGLPEPTVLKSEFGEYEINFEQLPDSSLRYTRKLQINSGEFPPSEYEKYREFRRSTSRLDKTKILLKNNIQ